MVVHTYWDMGNKKSTRNVSRISTPNGLIFLSLKEGVIPRNILIGNVNMRRISNAVILEVQSDPCIPFIIWKVLHWVGGIKQESSEHSMKIPTYLHGENRKDFWGWSMFNRGTLSFITLTREDKFLKWRMTFVESWGLVLAFMIIKI